MMNHHGDRKDSELMRMFREQASENRPREYPSGRIGDDDEGALAYTVGTDEHGVIRIDFNKPVTWLGMEPKQAVELAQSLIKFARSVSTEPLVVQIH